MSPRQLARNREFPISWVKPAFPCYPGQVPCYNTLPVILAIRATNLQPVALKRRKASVKANIPLQLKLRVRRI